MGDILALFAPSDPSRQVGRRYALLVRGLPCGEVGLNWWPLECRPEPALQDYMSQIKGLLPETQGRVMNIAVSMLGATMYRALCEEAAREEGDALSEPLKGTEGGSEIAPPGEGEGGR